MKAKLLTRYRKELSGSSFVEMKVWSVPKPVDPSRHNFKYSLVMIEGGVRVIGFDNERGKGDHLHRGDQEADYVFVSIDQLIDDFWSEVKKWNAI